MPIVGANAGLQQFAAATELSQLWLLCPILQRARGREQSCAHAHDPYRPRAAHWATGRAGRRGDRVEYAHYGWP
jgi:hypothetical protein